MRLLRGNIVSWRLFDLPTINRFNDASSCNGVDTDWYSDAELDYPIRKGADVRRVLRCEKVGRTMFRRESKWGHLSELCALYQNGLWLSVCIAKVIGCSQSLGLLNAKAAFEGLEPCDGTLSLTVLRGKWVERPLLYPVVLNNELTPLYWCGDKEAEVIGGLCFLNKKCCLS